MSWKGQQEVKEESATKPDQVPQVFIQSDFGSRWIQREFWKYTGVTENTVYLWITAKCQSGITNLSLSCFPAEILFWYVSQAEI